MSDRIQQLVDLIQTLMLLKSTSEEAANVFEKVIQSKANAHEGGLAGYLKEITADAKTATTTIAILEREIKAVSALPVRAAAEETPTSEGTRPAPVVSDAARKRKEVQDKLDEERRALRAELRGDNRPAVVKRHSDRQVNYERLLAQLDEQIDEREDTLRDLIRRTQTKMRTPAKTSRSSSPVADPEYADMKWALTTPDTRPATSYAVTPNRGGRVSVAQSGGARPPENASVSAIVKYVNTQLRHENPAETRPEIAPIVAELQKLVKDREETTASADRNRINQQIKQAFKKISQSSGTVSNTQRQTAQESIIAPIIEALRAVKLDDPILNAAMSPIASSSEIESALTRAIEMLVTRLENGAPGRVGETALTTEGFEFLRPAAFDQLLKRLKTVVAEATTRPIIPRSRTVDPGNEDVSASAAFFGDGITLTPRLDSDIPDTADTLRSSRVFPGQVTRIGANISKYIQSVKASLNPKRRYGSEAQGIDVRAGSQVVAGSSSAVFGGGMDAEVQKAVDQFLATVTQDINEGKIVPASIAGQTVDLPESLAKMVVEAIQSSSILSEHTTAFGRMAGTRGPRGAIVTGDPVRKFVALFAGDLINQYTSTGSISDQSASRFVEQTVAPEQEREVTLAATHAKRLRERLVYQKDQADLSMVTAAPAMANRYRTESAKLGKEIQLLDEILTESENPEEEKKLAQRRGQIALPESKSPSPLTRDQALTVLFRIGIGSVPAAADAVAPIMSKAQEVSAGLAQTGLTIPARPSYGASPVQSLVEYMTSGQSMALERYQTTPISQQLDTAGTMSSGRQNREIIEIISDSFGLSRQSGSAGNVVTGLYYGARATDESGKMLQGEKLDESLGGGYKTKKGLQSLVQASAEMGSYGSAGIPLIEYAKLATSSDLDAEEQSLFQEVQAKLPHLQTIDNDSLKQLAELDTSMDPKELIKRVLTLAAPAIRGQIEDSIRRQGATAGMGVDQVNQMISDYDTAGIAPAGFQDAFRALEMFDPTNINTTDVSAAVNRSLSLFSTLLTDNVQSGEGMPQFAARVLGREDRLTGTGPAVAAALPDKGSSYSLLGKGGEVANEESGQAVGGTYGRNVDNQIKIQEALSEFESLTAEIAEMRSRIALAPHESDKILPIIAQKNEQLQRVKQKLDNYRASEPDTVSQRFEALSAIAQMNNIDPETRSAAIYDLGIMQEIFNQTSRYEIDEAQGFGSGTQEQRLTNLIAHKAKLDRLQKLREERAALEAESPGDRSAKAIEAVVEGSDVDGEIAAVTKDISAGKAADIPARVETFVPNYNEKQSYVNRDATIGAYAGKNPEYREDDPSQDSMAIVHDLEAQTLTAAISDGVSQSHRSSIASRLLSGAATTLPIDTPFTMENIVDRANASPLSEIEEEILAAQDLSGVNEGFRRTDEQLTGMSLKLVQTAIQRAKEKAAKEKREATVKDYYEAVSQVQDEASMSDEEYLKYFLPGSAFGADLSGRRKDLKDKSTSSSNATLSAYRRRFNPDTGKYEHSVVRLGDSPIVSPDLKLLLSDTAIGGQPSQTNTGPGGIVIDNKPHNPLFEQSYETDQPVGIVLASDAFQDKASTDILSDPSTLHRGTVDQSLLSRVEETPGVYSKKDDRSLIVIGSGAAGPSLSLPGAVETAPETIDEQIARVQSEIAALETPATKLAREAAERGIKRKADLDLQIAEAAREAAQSQQVIELMQRQAQGLDTEDSDIRFVVDNTGIPVSYEDKQVIDRTSLRPLVRTKMTVDDTGESGFVSNLNVRDIVDQAEAVKPTPELMDEINAMSDADLAAVEMPAKVLTDEERKTYQYLRQASEQAKEEARKIYEADTPLGEAVREYYRTTNVEERDRMTLGDIGTSAIPGLKEAVAEYELQRGISLGSDERTGTLGKAEEATPLQLAARLFRSSRAAVREYETEFGVEPAFSARDIMNELLASSARAEVDSAPAGSAETATALEKTIGSFAEEMPEMKGPTDRAPRRSRRSAAAIVDEIDKPYTAKEAAAARNKVKSLAGRTDLTTAEQRELSEARKRLHNYAMKRLTTKFGDNKGVMQIANLVAGLTPPDWAKDEVQGARVSAISQAMADLKPGQLAKLKDVDLRDPVQMDILSKDPALQPIMALLADQDIDAALKYRSGTTEYDEAKGLLSAIEGAKKRLPVPEPTAEVPTDAKRLFFDLETSIATKPEDRLIFQAATGLNDGKVIDMYAVPLNSSAEEINRIAADPTIPDDEKRKLIRALALKQAGKPPLVEGRASDNDVSSGVIDNLVEAAMIGRPIYGQGDIRKELQLQIASATTVAGHNIEGFDLPTVYGGEMAVPDAVKAKTEDTLLMSRNMYPGSHTLSDTYEVVTGGPLVNAHDARADTEAVQRIFPQVSDPEERAKITEAYLAKHGITMDSTVGQLVAIPKIADIADTEERKKASRRVAKAHAFYRPLADMQDFTRRITKSGGKTILRDADRTVAAEQGWYDMSPAAKASLFERMNTMFKGHTKLNGKKIEELDDAELDEFVKEINTKYLEPNADAAVGGDFGGMQRLLEEKVGGWRSFTDRRSAVKRRTAIEGKTIEDVMRTAGSSGVTVGDPVSKETLGSVIEDISLGTEVPTKIRTPGSTSTSDGGSKEPPREPPVTFSDDADSGERGGLGGGITTIASATIDTLHAGAVEINIHGGNVTIDANFSAGAAEKMQKSLVYISNKDGMNVNGDVTSIGGGGGGGGYRRVSAADRAILNTLDAAKNEISKQLQTETDPAVKERLRGNLNEVSRQAIRAIVEPKANAINEEGLKLSVGYGLEAAGAASDSTESLKYYNEAAAQAHQDLTAQLEAQQAIPEGTDGRDEEIQRIEKQIAKVEELINVLNELNSAEQRVGSARGTRNIDSAYGTAKPSDAAKTSGYVPYRRISDADKASLGILESTKNSISDRLRTENDPAIRESLRKDLTAASLAAIDAIITPKASKVLDPALVASIGASSADPSESLLWHNMYAKDKLDAVSSQLDAQRALPEDAPGRDAEITRLEQERAAVLELIDALNELNTVQQRVGSASGTRPIESTYGLKPTTDSYTGTSKYRKFSPTDQAAFNVLESTKNDVAAKLRDETDPTLRDNLRQSLNAATQRTIAEVLEPKARNVFDPVQIAALTSSPMTPEETLVTYNEMAQYNLGDLSKQLAAQEALPEGSAGREDAIDSLKKEIAAVEELISVLTELNAIEQRVGSASGTRNVNTPYGTSSGTGTGGAAGKYYSRKSKEDEQVLLQLARNSFDQSGGSMGIAGGSTTNDARQFLVDQTRQTSTAMINSSGIGESQTVADIAAVAGADPEVQDAYDDAAKRLNDLSTKVGGSVDELADDLYLVANALEALKKKLTPLAATSPEAAASLAVVQAALDEVGAAGKEQRSIAGVIEADNRKKLLAVEEQMQAAASRPGFFAGGRRTREVRELAEGYLQDTFGQKGREMLMNRGRIQAYTTSGKRIDMDRATVSDQRETVRRLQAQGVNVTAEDMTNIARLSGRVTQTQRSAPMGDKLFYAASKIRDTQSVVQAVVDTATSLANIPQMASGAIQQFASSATGSNRIMTTARGLALNPENYQAALNAADAQRKRFGGSLTSNLGQVSSFIPLSNAYGVDISKTVKVARKLAAFDPAQGMEGASIAIKEFLSGNVASLSRRFEINRSALSQINSGDADKMLENLDSLLSSMGVTDRLIDEQANSMATKYDKMTGNLESLQISSTTAIVDFITPALESLIGEQSYFGKNVKERTLNTLAKESITSYGDQALTDRDTGLSTVSLYGSNEAFAYTTDKVLERANARMMKQAGKYNAATGGTTAVAPYRLIGNMKPEERYKVQQDALKYRLQGMNETQAVMQSLRDNQSADYNIGAETDLQRTSVNGAMTLRQMEKLNPEAYAKAVESKVSELNSLTTSLSEDLVKSSTFKGGGGGGRGGLGRTRQGPSRTKANIVKQIDIDTYEVLPEGAKEGETISVRIPNIDAFEKGTSRDLKGKAAAADLVGMDRAMVGKTYKGRSGPEITLAGQISNKDQYGRSVVNIITKEGKNLGVSLIAAGEAAVSFTDELTSVQRQKLETVAQLAAELNLGSMNKDAARAGMGGIPAISDEVRSDYFWNKYGMGLGATTVGGGAAGYGALTGYSALMGAGGALTAGGIATGLGVGALALGGLYAGGAYLVDSADSSPEKMRELLKMETERRLKRSKAAEFLMIANAANAAAQPGEMLVGGVTEQYLLRQTGNGKIRGGGGRGGLGQTQQNYKGRDYYIQEGTAAAQEVYMPFYEEEVKKSQEEYLAGDDYTKRVLARQVINPFTNQQQSYSEFQSSFFAMQKLAETGDVRTATFLRDKEAETNAIVGGTASLKEMKKPIEYAEKAGMMLDVRDLALAEAAPLIDEKKILEGKRDAALNLGLTGEASNITEQITGLNTQIEAITISETEYNAIALEARKIPISLENAAMYTASQLAFMNDSIVEAYNNPVDFKQEAKMFEQESMERNFQRRGQRVNSTLTAFARQAIMGLGMERDEGQFGPNTGVRTKKDVTMEGRAVRMIDNSSLMPKNKVSGMDIVKQLNDAQIAAVREQQSIASTNRQIGLANAPEMQLLKSGFTNFAMYMNMAGATAEDLGRSFMTTMNLLSEGNPRYGLDLAQQMTGLSYETMIGMQLRPRTGVDAEGNPISSLNGANGMPYGYNAKPGEIVSGPMVMPYTSGPRGTMAYSRDMMAVNAQGVRENALGIAPSQWQQFVSNATNANAELQRRAMSNAIQERDLNKNHLRNLEDITRNGMRQLESIHLNYTRNMFQLTQQADLVKNMNRANMQRSVATADISEADRTQINKNIWARDMRAQHYGQGRADLFLQSPDLATLMAIDPTLETDIAALQTASTAYDENADYYDPEATQALQDEKLTKTTPVLDKLKTAYANEKDPLKKAVIEKAIMTLSPDPNATVELQNSNVQETQYELGDAVARQQLGTQISDMQWQRSYRGLDIANNQQSMEEASKSQDPLALLNAGRTTDAMGRGFAQADRQLAAAQTNLNGLAATAPMMTKAYGQTFANIDQTGTTAFQNILNGVDDFSISFQQQMEDALRNFDRQRLDMIQAFADAAVEIASIVPEEMIPIMQATSAFMNTQRQAELLWLSGRTDEANALAYQGMLKLGEVVYGEGKGKAYADKYSQNFEDMADVAARDVPQGDLGKFGVNTEDGWALRVKFTTAKEKKPEDKKPNPGDKPGGGNGPFGNKGGGSPKPSDGEPEP